MPAIRTLALTLLSLAALAAEPPTGTPTGSPTGSIRDVRHVVILIQENRSFDHYFGTLRGVRGFSDPGALTLPSGLSVFHQPGNGGYVLPFPAPAPCLEDVPHDWATGLLAWHGGAWDRWLAAKGSTAMTYFTRDTLPFYYALADAYTVCDAYHCSVLGPTNPNRLYLLSGTLDPEGTRGGPAVTNLEPDPGFAWTTYPERLEAAGVSWKVYQEADNFDDNALAWFEAFKRAPPGSPLRERGLGTVPELVAGFRADVVAGTLPQVSWLVAPPASSEHPGNASPPSGAHLTARLLKALAANAEVARSTVFMLTYDENGGFFDHVPPPIPPAGTAGEFVFGLPLGLGARVPMILISPWSRGGYVCSQTFDHTSILQFLEQWTGVPEPNLSAWRRQVCGDLTAAFDFTAPDYTLPVLPTVEPALCGAGFHPPVPARQREPTQEPGTRPTRPSPRPQSK